MFLLRPCIDFVADSLLNVTLIGLWGTVSDLCLIMHYLVTFLVLLSSLG